MWLYKDLLGSLKSKRKAYRQRRDWQVTKEVYQEVARVFRDKIREANIKNKLYLMTDMKDKKRFYQYVGQKGKTTEAAHPLSTCLSIHKRMKLLPDS